jgi:ABC-type Fe3+-hydroxamate transport system substrate-binding protein
MTTTRAFYAAFALAGLGVLAGPAIGQDKPTCEAGTHLFENRLLISPVCVPDDPKRVAFIDDIVLNAIELGIPSVTTSHYSDIIVADFPGIASKLDPATTTSVGNTWEMNGEVLLTADPDLVVTAKYWDVAIPLAQAVAPTLVVDSDIATDWRDIPRMLAALFHKEAEQAALEADVEARVAAFTAALEASDAGRTFSFTTVENATSLWSFTTEAFGAHFAESAGLKLADTIPSPEEAAKLVDGSTVAFPVSQEQLATIDADHIFLYSNLGTDPEELLKDNAFFQRFAAERPGQIHFIRGEYWFRPGAASAHRIVDDLYRDVLGVDAERVSPNPMRWTYVVTP